MLIVFLLYIKYYTLNYNVKIEIHIVLFSKLLNKTMCAFTIKYFLYLYKQLNNIYLIVLQQLLK